MEPPSASSCCSRTRCASSSRRKRRRMAKSTSNTGERASRQWHRGAVWQRRLVARPRLSDGIGTLVSVTATISVVRMHAPYIGRSSPAPCAPLTGDPSDSACVCIRKTYCCTSPTSAPALTFPCTVSMRKPSGKVRQSRICSRRAASATGGKEQSISGSAAIPTDSAARFCNEASRVSPRAAPAGEKGEVLSCCCTRATASSPAPMIRKCSKSLGFSLLKEAEAAAIPSTESR